MCSLIIIGAGLAGLSAAEAALKHGVRKVIVLSSSKAGSTQIAPWGVIRTQGVQGKSIYSSIWEYGCGLSDPLLLRTFCERLDETVRFVKDLAPTEKAANVGFKVTGGGSRLARNLKERILKLGGTFMNGECLAVKTENQRVRGVYILSENKLLFQRTEAVVLATGGGSSLFRASDNPIAQDGSGYGIALAAGAALKDMEFQTYHPMAVAMKKGGTIRYRMLEMFKLDKAPVYDRAGRRLHHIEDFLSSHRSHNSLYEMAKMIHRYGSIQVEINQRLLSAEPVVHSFLGGVRIDENAETTVKGLFACGEVVGGLNGANRLAATAFPEAIIFGQLAGKNCAERIKVSERESEMECLGEMDCTKQEFKGNYKTTMPVIDRDLFIIKEKERIAGILSRHIPEPIIEDDYENIEKVGAIRRYNRELTINAIARAAMLRKESRGAFYRDDYPVQSEKYAGNIQVKKMGNQVVASMMGGENE